MAQEGSERQDRKRDSSRLEIPLDDARDGCVEIANNIHELADHANRFLDFDEEIVSTRIAAVLVIHAMDEAGKLLSIIREGIAAKAEGNETISAPWFYSHPAKGREAGTIGLAAVDWLERTVTSKLGATKEAKIEFQEYRTHLETLKRDFRRIRERTLYVDYEDGTWISPVDADYKHVGIDAYLLNILAIFVKANIKAGLSFPEIDEVVRSIYDSVDFDGF